MDNCLSSINFEGHIFNFDSCSNVIVYQLADDTKFNQKSLVDLSKTCFEAYKYRLSDVSEVISKIGETEYKFINQELINIILPYGPLKFSFSITPDPSLHFFVRFSGNISLFVETFLDVEDGHDTFIQIAKSNHNVYERNLNFDDALHDIRKILDKEFLGNPKTFFDITKAFEECQPYQKDLFLLKQR